MATSLKVTLELDDKGYVTRIKGAVAETEKLADVSKKVENAGVGAFTKLGQQTEVVIGRLKALAAAYVGFQTIQTGFALANDLDDLSKATDISIQKILQFQTALIAAGGKGEDAARMITNLNNTLQSARDGSSSAQEQMLKLGFSFSDMANLTPEEALQKTINALAKMPNPIERNALAFQLLGKQAALIQWDEVSAGIQGTASAYDSAAASAIKAADLMNKFDLQMKAMKTSLIIAIEPLSEMFKYLDQLSGGGQGGFVLNAFKTVFETVAVLAVNIGFIIKAIVDEVTTLYEQAKTVLSNPFKTENWAKAADIHEKAMARAKENALKLEEAEKRILGISQQKAAEEKAAQEKSAKAVTPKPKQADVTAYYAPQIAALKQMTAEYEKQENLIGSKLRQATANIGLGEDQKALVALTEVTQRYNDAQEALLKKRDALAAGPQTAGTQAQIAEINSLLKVQSEIYDRIFAKTQEDINANNERISQDKILNNLYNERVALQDRLGALQDESAKVGLTTLAKKYYDIEAAAKKAAEAEIRSEEVRRFGIELAGKGKYKLTEQQKKDIYDAANERVKAEQEATKQTYEAQRTFAAGWKEAFNSYVENATNAALQAQTMFQTITRGLEDLIVNFVKTGKLNFKDFANTLIAEFARIQAKKIVAGLFGSGTPSGGDIFSLLSGLVGRATGGAVNGNTPYLVGEQGPELFVPNTAGKIVANGNMGTSVTYNIQAVDASSFRQLVASDPEFIYAVTEKGRSSVPYRR